MSPDLSPIIAALETERQVLAEKLRATWPFIGMGVGLAYGLICLFPHGITFLLANLLLAAPALFFNAQRPLDWPTWSGVLFLGLFSNGLFIPRLLWQQEFSLWLALPVMGFMGMIVFVFYAGFFIRFFSQAYCHRFKLNLVSHLIQQRLPQSRYHPKGGFDRAVFTQSRLFRKGIGAAYQYDQEDFVEAEIDGLQLKFCEIRIHQNHDKITISGSPKPPSPHQQILKPSSFKESEIFQGLFLQAQFPKQTLGETLVLETPAWFESTQGLERVKLESTEFAQLYDCLSSNQVEARYILSTSLMERILDYGQRARVLPIFAFIHGQFYIAIPNQQNFFEPNLFKPIQTTDLTGYWGQLDFVLEILSDLQLNRQIWPSPANPTL